MRRGFFVALGASILALAIPPVASATGSTESGDGGGNCSSSGAIIAANCTNISGPQVQVAGGFGNEQNQNNNQQNGDNSGTSNANTNAVAVSSPSDANEGDESSGSGGNCSQHGALIAANCTNYSGGQEQIGGGFGNAQNQNNNQQNGDNSGTSNANTNAVHAGGSPTNGYEGDESSGSGGNCTQKFTAVAANCTNISKGQEQIGGGAEHCLPGYICEESFSGGGGGASPQNQNNNQQNGDNSGTHNYNANVIAGHAPNGSGKDGNSEWSNEAKEQSSSDGGSGGNCTQKFAALSINCTNYSGGQEQFGGGDAELIGFVPGGGGSSSSPQNQNNNQQNGDNSGTSNQNLNVIGGGGHPSNGGREGNSVSSSDGGSGGNCTQSFAIFSANCTNISKGQEQEGGGGGGGTCLSICSAFVPGGGGSGSPQNQNNNQQNGDNSGTHNYNANVIAGHPPNGSNKDGDSEWSSREVKEQSSDGGGSGGNCTQKFVFLAANCTNYSGGQWQEGGGGRGPLVGTEFISPGGGGGAPQNQNNNQQNGDNSGTHNYNANVIAKRRGPPGPRPV